MIAEVETGKTKFEQNSRLVQIQIEIVREMEYSEIAQEKVEMLEEIRQIAALPLKLQSRM